MKPDWEEARIRFIPSSKDWGSGVASGADGFGATVETGVAAALGIGVAVTLGTGVAVTLGTGVAVTLGARAAVILGAGSGGVGTGDSDGFSIDSGEGEGDSVTTCGRWSHWQSRTSAEARSTAFGMTLKA
jgi:hypothetical protein